MNMQNSKKILRVTCVLFIFVCFMIIAYISNFTYESRTPSYYRENNYNSLVYPNIHDTNPLINLNLRHSDSDSHGFFFTFENDQSSNFLFQENLNRINMLAPKKSHFEPISINTDIEDAQKKIIQKYLAIENLSKIDLSVNNESEENAMSDEEKKKCRDLLKNIILPSSIDEVIKSLDFNYLVKTKDVKFSIVNKKDFEKFSSKIENKFLRKEVIDKIEILSLDSFCSNENEEKIFKRKYRKKIAELDYYSNTKIKTFDILNLKKIELKESKIDEFLNSKPTLNIHEKLLCKYLDVYIDSSFISQIEDHLYRFGIEIPDILLDHITMSIMNHPVLIEPETNDFVDINTIIDNILKTDGISPFTRRRYSLDEIECERSKLLKKELENFFEKLTPRFSGFFQKLRKYRENIDLCF